MPPPYSLPNAIAPLRPNPGGTLAKFEIRRRRLKRLNETTELLGALREPETDILAMQDAGVPRVVCIGSNGFHLHERAGRERFAQERLELGIASACAMVDGDECKHARRKSWSSVLAPGFMHNPRHDAFAQTSGAHRDRDGQDHAATFPQILDPGSVWVRHPRVDEHGVARVEMECGPITGMHAYVPIGREICLRAMRELGIHLGSYHAAARPNRVREDRGEVTYAASQM